MSDLLDLQVHALLSRLHAERDASCRRLRENAAESASRLVGEARLRARSRIKEAVREKRRRVSEHCRRVQAEVDARERDRQFSDIEVRLSRGMSLLPAALAARWADAGARQAWCRHLVEEAASALGAGAWRIEVAPGLPAGELETLASRAARAAGEDAAIEESAALAAGLRILRDGACYDGTVTGLLSNRLRVQAALLAELDELDAPG